MFSHDNYLSGIRLIKTIYDVHVLCPTRQVGKEIESFYWRCFRESRHLFLGTLYRVMRMYGYNSICVSFYVHVGWE